jgi:hypothetical protein
LTRVAIGGGGSGRGVTFGASGWDAFWELAVGAGGAGATVGSASTAESVALGPASRVMSPRAQPDAVKADAQATARAPPNGRSGKRVWRLGANGGTIIHAEYRFAGRLRKSEFRQSPKSGLRRQPGTKNCSLLTTVTAVRIACVGFCPEGRASKQRAASNGDRCPVAQ